MSESNVWTYGTTIAAYAVAALHFAAYPLVVGARVRQGGVCGDEGDDGIPAVALLCPLMFPCGFIAAFAYGFPLLLLADGTSYCAGETPPTDDRFCDSPEDAGAGPMLFVFAPTALMWVLDAVLLANLNPKFGEASAWWFRDLRFADVAIWRLGTVLLYCSLVCFSGSRRSREEAEDPEWFEDEDALLAFAERQRTAAVASVACACALLSSVAAIVLARRSCRRGGPLSEDDRRPDEEALSTPTPARDDGRASAR